MAKNRAEGKIVRESMEYPSALDSGTAQEAARMRATSPIFNCIDYLGNRKRRTLRLETPLPASRGRSSGALRLNPFSPGRLLAFGGPSPDSVLITQFAEDLSRHQPVIERLSVSFEDLGCLVAFSSNHHHVAFARLLQRPAYRHAAVDLRQISFAGAL